jgi:hypothetical protein
MPKIKHPVDKICAFCRYYSIVVGQDENGPYCELHGVFFPEPTRWISNPFKSKPGMRTCAYWKSKNKFFELKGDEENGN